MATSLSFYLLFSTVVIDSGTKTMRDMRFMVTGGPQGDKAYRDWGERRSSWYRGPKVQMNLGTEREPMRCLWKYFVDRKHSFMALCCYGWERCVCLFSFSSLLAARPPCPGCRMLLWGQKSRTHGSQNFSSLCIMITYFICTNSLIFYKFISRKEIGLLLEILGEGVLYHF